MKKNETFKFKKFEVKHQINAQKVSTDSVLLGAWSNLEESRNILDIGTGCGILALMAAQRTLDAQITAIEIDRSFAEEARINFTNSLFSNRINLLNEDVRIYNKMKFDHIVCNPPYFSASLKSESESRNKARHDLTLNFESLAETCSNLLVMGGKISLVIPNSRKVEVIKSFSGFEFYVARFCEIKHTIKSEVSLVLLEFETTKNELVFSSELIIKNGNEFNEGYKQLLSNFLLAF
jgi:tRNA1Val (adenine37-N6)-methyltransferase